MRLLAIAVVAIFLVCFAPITWCSWIKPLLSLLQRPKARPRVRFEIRLYTACGVPEPGHCEQRGLTPSSMCWPRN